MKLVMYRGDAAVFSMDCNQSDGSPLDISTGTLWFTAKSSSRQPDTEAVFQKTIGDGITITDGPGGLATVQLAPADTSGIYAPSYLVWDLQYVTTGALPYTLKSGVLLVKPDITKDIA